MKFSLKQITNTDASAAVILIRLIVGLTFLSEGIQKFLFPADLGVGRFMKIGIPAPGFFSYFTAVFEILGGIFVLLGLYTRLASIPLLIVNIVAIISTKIPMLFHDGFWKMAHETRVDWAMFLGIVFLLIEGAGRLSLDYYLSHKNRGFTI